MKAIERCIECAEYDRRQHRCKRGAKQETSSLDPFYDDCPLPEATVHNSGKWYKEPLPTPPNAKNTTMEHYRLVCPFCGRRNGKKREKFCADCGAILR